MTLRKILIALACLLASNIATADQVRLESVSVHKQIPAQVSAEPGAESQAAPVEYVVRIKGTLPTARALPVQLFIGDYPIREYGTTSDGIYFKLRDPQLLRQLHGKPFRYATGPGTPRQTGLVFQAPAE